jgi:glucosylceramidase
LIAVILLLNGSCKSKDNTGPVYKEPVVTGKANVWLTRGDKTKLLNYEGELDITGTLSVSWPVVTIDTTQEFQPIDGFGAALTGSSAYLLQQKMDASTRSAVLKKLFDPVDGIGISFLRLTIGSSDFSTSYYTYDDLAAGETDFNLSKFSLDKDRADVIPALKEILQTAPSVTLMGSPWSPPAWMKTGGSLIGGSLKTDCYSVYADYFVRYIQAMKDEGITISAITPQNEPLYSAAAYPCMKMTAEDQTTFIRDHLGPKFLETKTNAKIIIYDHNWDEPGYPISVLNDPETNQYVAGSAFHGYGGDVSAMSTVHNTHPEKGLWFTEISGGTWATNFSDNLVWNMRNIFIGTTLNWSRCALMWNLVLDQNGAPHENNQSTCRGVVTFNTANGQITYNEEYYSIAHFSKFVRPGAVRIAAVMPQSLTGVIAVAFRNPDGKKTLVACNTGATDKYFSIRQGNGYFSYVLPGLSVATIVW